MTRPPLLNAEDLAEYRALLVGMTEENLIAEALAEIRKGFYDAVYATNDQKAEACLVEFTNRDKSYLYNRAYNGARASVGLPVSQTDLAEAAAPDA